MERLMKFERPLVSGLFLCVNIRFGGYSGFGGSAPTACTSAKYSEPIASFQTRHSSIKKGAFGRLFRMRECP